MACFTQQEVANGPTSGPQGPGPAPRRVLLRSSLFLLLIVVAMGTLEATTSPGLDHESDRPSLPLASLRDRVSAAYSSRRRAWGGRTTSPELLALQLASKAGLLCECLQWKGEVSNGLTELSEKEQAEVGRAVGRVAQHVILLADHCGVDLPRAILAKMRLNALKYPASLVRGKAGKYSDYSEHTSWSRGSEQETEMRHATPGRHWMPQVCLLEVRSRLRQFVDEREWSRFHSPRNLVLAMAGEVGELCESVADLKATGWTAKARDGLSQELSDVMIYLTRLADVCELDLTAEIVKAIDDETATTLTAPAPSGPAVGLALLLPSVGRLWPGAGPTDQAAPSQGAKRRQQLLVLLGAGCLLTGVGLVLLEGGSLLRGGGRAGQSRPP